MPSDLTSAPPNATARNVTGPAIPASAAVRIERERSIDVPYVRRRSGRGRSSAHRFYPQEMPPTITPVLVAGLLPEDEWLPVYVHVIDHADGRVLVDTGMTALHPAVADMDPRLT